MDETQGNFADVLDFHEKFGLPIPSEPSWLPEDVKQYRVKFLEEELKEYRDAETLEDAVDALIDLVYVVCGTAVLHGFLHWEAHWSTVHRANMTKRRVDRAEDSKRGHAFDIVKPAGWIGPDHTSVFKNYPR